MQQGTQYLTEKDGASITARPTEFATGQGVASHPVACALKVGSHSFPFLAKFISFAEGRTPAGASGIAPLSGSARAHVSDLHHEDASV